MQTWHILCQACEEEINEKFLLLQQTGAVNEKHFEPLARWNRMFRHVQITTPVTSEATKPLPFW